MTTLRWAGMLLLAIACSHALVPAARSDLELQALLETATQRAVARLASAEACEVEPTLRIDLTEALGPLARALHGTGRGSQLSALDAALCSAGSRALFDQGSWLASEALRFEVGHPEEVLAGATGGATAAYRAAIEPDFRERYSAGLPAALEAAEAPEALAAVRASAEALPLPRALRFDAEAELRERWPGVFFRVLAEEEARVRDESRESVASFVPRRP
jgi:hypothetical protein